MRNTNTSERSPCLRNCCLDDDLTCLGCFRSLDEIKEWTVVDIHRRRIILQNARQRREACQALGAAKPAMRASRTVSELMDELIDPRV